VPVIVEAASERELAPVTWYSGTVISRNDSRLAAEVEGRLVWIADVGTEVVAGDAVARIDDTLIKEQLREYEATVKREQARHKFSAQEVTRFQRLAKRNVAAQSRLDQAESDRDVAFSELKVAKARVMQAREQLVRTQIRAPFNGIVSERLMQTGEWAKSGDPIARLVDSHTLEVQSWIPVKVLAHVRVGSELNAKAGQQQAAAKVRAIVPIGDDRSRLYELRLALNDGMWPVGQTLRVAVPTAKSRKVIAVPRDALVLRRDGTSVYRITDGNKAEKISVVTGIASGPYIEVTGGIVPGDRVVIRGGERLRPGATVKVLNSGSGK